MRGKVAKRLSKEAANQVTVKATLEGRQQTKLEFDRLLKYKKRVYNRTINEPKLKQSRRQQRQQRKQNEKWAEEQLRFAVKHEQSKKHDNSK